MNLASLTWRKSSYSQGGGNQCVEVAVMPGAVAIRDSKNPTGPVHIISRDDFRDLVARIKRGDLSL